MGYYLSMNNMDLSTIINAIKEKHSTPQEHLIRVPDIALPPSVGEGCVRRGIWGGIRGMVQESTKHGGRERRFQADEMANINALKQRGIKYMGGNE